MSKLIPVFALIILLITGLFLFFPKVPAKSFVSGEASGTFSQPAGFENHDPHPSSLSASSKRTAIHSSGRNSRNESNGATSRVSSAAEKTERFPPDSSAGRVKKPTKQLLDVPYLSQKDIFPTGCELVSALMVLRYYGVSITGEQLLAHTPMGSLIPRAGGGLTGPHPNDAFIGDPRTPYGYGCYPPVIKTALCSVLDSHYSVADVTGCSLPELASRYLDQSVPLMIWATIGMQEPSDGTSWTLNSTGRPFTWRRPEHCLVLTGYDQTRYYFNDPYNGNGRVSYPKALVERRFEQMGRRAAAVIKA